MSRRDYIKKYSHGKNVKFVQKATIQNFNLLLKFERYPKIEVL